MVSYGKAFSLGSAEHHEEALLLLELLRAKRLSGKRLTLIPSSLIPNGTNATGKNRKVKKFVVLLLLTSYNTSGSDNANEERDITLIARVLSLLPARLGQLAWDGPVDLVRE